MLRVPSRGRRSSSGALQKRSKPGLWVGRLPSPRNIHVAAAASPRRVSPESWLRRYNIKPGTRLTIRYPDDPDDTHKEDGEAHTKRHGTVLEINPKKLIVDVLFDEPLPLASALARRKARGLHVPKTRSRARVPMAWIDAHS